MATNQTVFNRFNFFPKTFWEKLRRSLGIKSSMWMNLPVVPVNVINMKCFIRGRTYRRELTRKDARILWNRTRAVEQTDECREPVPHRTCVWSKFSVHSQCNLFGQGCKIRHIHSSPEHPLVRLRFCLVAQTSKRMSVGGY